MEWIYDTTPAFSPDSTKVAFVRWNSAASSDLFVVNLLNGQIKQLTFDGKQILSPRWSRDGKNILFVSGRGDIQRLWQISHRGGEPSLVNSVPVDISQFDISPDGEILAYTQSINDTSISVDSLASNSLNRSSHPCSINASRTDDSPQFSRWKADSIYLQPNRLG
jgi:Tol biopolymer transport system component